ncbi:MAG: PEP-CTERM/exosortase system-associated acyltransferase [Candidatus Thiodiazotropha sp. (ex Dulcina madagascariensis)]|nr:PEP-CTERM/exosortase system-associated acyltransferase [Candidatus Thiodiazotropha sp. (ex Epidulcina cf. delphinae)]MCU7923789.1 PEP-CTERM/exosortase system-associated acyltransferase [Candidatus Thiodiazotropha sp. (ex Dulcina madagascariensis)]MCU7927383.1 PEP-CTERM/exosortase system-associated acyltransferase [Candidatus Thiodiazotropha sp. (ex Dulcina madagascariensis)]MCU7934176.1 PEP-CTERM/exosortase system-associated acyltransferase [Candidatus Thiodiazotropha sp. (ex Dulcina madagasc
MESLAENFSRYFRPRYAVTRHQQRYSYTIRYQVYAEELGWEPLNDHRLEMDDCDDYAHHCLLEHKRTGDIAGSVRLVVPPAGQHDVCLPYQLHGISSINSDRLSKYSPDKIGEISRLAVLNSFRRRPNETGKPFILGKHNTNTIFTEKEKRNFPNISIGLYLSAIAMVDLCNLDLALVVMEPRLQRHLKRFGLFFHQISNPFEFRGQRALFELPGNKLTNHMNPQIKALYDLIYEDLAEQPWYMPQERPPIHQFNEPV